MPPIPSPMLPRLQIASLHEISTHLQELQLELGDTLLAQQQLRLHVAMLLLHALHLSILGLQPRCQAGLLHAQHLTLQRAKRCTQFLVSEVNVGHIMLPCSCG